MKKTSNSRFAAIFSLLVALVFSNTAYAGPKIEIRFVSAIASYRASSDSNQPFDFYVESAGYDALWRGQIFGTSFVRSEEYLLSGVGHTKNVYKIGGGSCTGTLSRNEDYSMFSPTIISNTGGIVKMKIDLPHFVGNTGLNAFLMDKNQPEQSACRTATVGLGQATCFNPTRDCYTIDGSISPGFPAQGDSTKFGKFFVHKDAAYFEFNEDRPSASIPFTYNVFNQTMGSDGNVIDTFKVGWAGYLTISTDIGKGKPPASNPFSFFDFDPTTLNGSFPDIGAPPSGPSDDNPTPNDNDFDPSEVGKWLKQFLDNLKNFFNLFNSPLQARSLVNVSDVATFDDATGAVSILSSSVGGIPATGSLRIKIKIVKKEKAADFSLDVPKKGKAIELVKGVAQNIEFSIDKASLKLLKSGKPSKAFFAISYKPSSGKKIFSKKGAVKLPKR